MSNHGLFCCAKIFQSVFPSRTDGIPVSGRAEANELSGAVQKRENRSGKESAKLAGRDLRPAAFRGDGFTKSRFGAGKRKRFAAVFPVKTGKSLDMEKGE